MKLHFSRFLEQLTKKRRETQDAQGAHGQKEAPKAKQFPVKPTSLPTGKNVLLIFVLDLNFSYSMLNKKKSIKKHGFYGRLIFLL